MNYLALVIEFECEWCLVLEFDLYDFGTDTTPVLWIVVLNDLLFTYCFEPKLYLENLVYILRFVTPKFD